MARTSVPPSDLEIEGLGARLPGSGQNRRPVARRLRISAVFAVAVLVLALAFPLRAQLNRSVALRLQRRWQAIAMLDQARSRYLTAVKQAGAPGDGLLVHSTIGQLYDEQAAYLISLAKSLHHDVIIDSDLRRLRAAMAHAIDLEVADLSHAANLWVATPAGTEPFYLDRQPATTTAIDEAAELLGGQTRRFSLAAPRPGPVPRFPIAETTLGAFQRFLDEPTGVTLLADTSAGLETIDIDASRVHPLQIAGLPAGVENLVVARPDWLVFQHPAPDGLQSSFSVVPARLPAKAVTIGTGQQVVAGSQPGTYWLIGPDDNAVEVDRNGARLGGPFILPPNRFVIAATATGLVLQPHLQSDQSLASEPIEIWDPFTARAVRTITTAGLGVLAADAGMVAWVSGSETIHLTDSSSGADRLIDTPGYVQQLVGAAFSPDGTRLAVSMGSRDGSRTVAAIVDVSSGVVQIATSGDFPPEAPGPIAWTAGGSRIFVPMSADTPADQLLTFAPGAAPHYLRLPDTGRVNVYAVASIMSG